MMLELDQMHTGFVYHYPFSKCTIVYYPLNVPNMCVCVVMLMYLCMLAYVSCTFVCTHMYRHRYAGDMCAHRCADLRLTLDVFLRHSPNYFILRQVLSLKTGLTTLASLASELSPGLICHWPLITGITSRTLEPFGFSLRFWVSQFQFLHQQSNA